MASEIRLTVVSVTPSDEGKVDVHLSVSGLKPGLEYRVPAAFGTIEQAAKDGKWDFMEILSSGMALASIFR